MNPKPRKLRVICDLDGVVYPFDETARSVLREHRGVDVPESDGWDSIRNHVSDDDWRFLWTDGVQYGLFRHGAPHAGAEAAIRELSHATDLAFITSRPHHAVPDTLAWLARYRFPVRELHFCPDRPKSDVLPHGDIYIDDGPHVIADLFKNTHHADVLIFDRPWNRDVEEMPSYNLHRLKDWASIVAFIRERSRA